MKKLLGIALVAFIFCTNTFADKEKVLSGIDKLSKNYDYHFFAHSTSGEQFWGSTLAKTNTLQSGYAKSTKNMDCRLDSFQANFEAPYKGTWDLVCPTFSASGSWSQESLISDGFGKGYSNRGNVISAYFSKNRMKIWGVAKNYFEGQDQKVTEKPKKQEPKIDNGNALDLQATLINKGLDIGNKYKFFLNDRNDQGILWGNLKIINKKTTDSEVSDAYVNKLNYVTWQTFSSNRFGYTIKDPDNGSTKSFLVDLDWKNMSAQIRDNNREIYTGKIFKPYKLFASTDFDEMKPYVEPPKKKKPKQTPKNDDNKIVAASSGTGFYVSSTGHIISNHHVVEGCDTVKLTFKGKEVSADVLAVDKMNDLAILKADLNPAKIYSVANEDAALLEDIIIAGYPLGKKVSAAIKTSKGSITALAGYGDNYSEFQTDAALNQGNSGGPIMDQKGNVVGVAVANYGKDAGVESFNFGIKSSTLKTFANANGLKFLPPNNKNLSNKELGKLITEATIYLECHMTVAKIKRMIAEAENRKAFFSEYQ